MSRDKPPTKAALVAFESAKWREALEALKTLDARLRTVEFRTLTRIGVDHSFASDVHVASEIITQWRRADVALRERKARRR